MYGVVQVVENKFCQPYFKNRTLCEDEDYERLSRFSRPVFVQLMNVPCGRVFLLIINALKWYLILLLKRTIAVRRIGANPKILEEVDENYNLSGLSAREIFRSLRQKSSIVVVTDIFAAPEKVLQAIVRN